MARVHHKMVGLTISIPERAKANLDRQAKDRGLASSLWAGQVFDLGFAAICARERSMPVTDADMDAIAGATLLLWARGDWDMGKIAKGLGVPEPTVEKILAAWREYRRAAS